MTVVDSLRETPNMKQCFIEVKWPHGPWKAGWIGWQTFGNRNTRFEGAKLWHRIQRGYPNVCLKFN